MNRTTLPTGREVIDTGKVLIGLRANEQRTPQPATHDADVVQDALLGKTARDLSAVQFVLLILAIVGAVAALAYKFGSPV